VEIGSDGSKWVYSAELKKQMYHSKEKHLFSNIQHQEHDFPVRIEFVFERNNSCKLHFSRWRKAPFVPNRPIRQS
jgi:hypothetical protein